VSSEAAAAPAAPGRVAASFRRVRDRALSARVAYVLGALIGVQWAAVLALALTVRHNGWLYYAGGDQLWHYSGAYVLAHGHLPPSFVGYGWSVLLAPVAAIAGPNIVSALPAMILFNTVVLLPVALLCVYGIASRIAGRLFGYWAAALWIVIPYTGILLLEPGYHQKYTELTLPQLLGLSSAPDFPSVVALLVSAYLCLRAFDSAGWHAAAGAGLAAGYAIAIKPSNALFLFAPGVLFAFRRWRALLPFAAGLAPAVLTLALWKYRGLGELAAAPAEPMRVAGLGDLADRIHNPELNSWEHLHQVLLGLREHFWAARVFEWLPLAGMIALALRSVRALLLLGTWFVAFLIAKGTYVPASIEDASFFRILMPAFPAYLLLAASTVLLVPGVRARPAPDPVRLEGRRLTAAVAAAAVVFAVLPAAVVAATPTLHDGGRQAVAYPSSLIPVTGRVAPTAKAVGGAVELTWPTWPERVAGVFYHVLRTDGANGGVACAGTPNGAANDCRLYMDAVGAVKETSAVDRPGPGTWTYRIGVAANWLDDPQYGDVTVVGTPVTVTVP
jgi:hypothetical protein